MASGQDSSGEDSGWLAFRRPAAFRPLIGESRDY